MCWQAGTESGSIGSTPTEASTMAFSDYFKNGANVALGAVCALAIAGIVAQRRGGYGDAWGSWGGGYGGFNEDDYGFQGHGGYEDDYSFQGQAGYEEQWGGQEQWGSQAMSYSEFVAQAIPSYTAQGMSPKDAMRAAASDWRALQG